MKNVIFYCLDNNKKVMKLNMIYPFHPILVAIQLLDEKYVFLVKNHT